MISKKWEIHSRILYLSSHTSIGSELIYGEDAEMFLWVENKCIVGPCPQSNQLERKLMFIRSQVLCCTLAHYANNSAILAVMLLCKSMLEQRTHMILCPCRHWCVRAANVDTRLYDLNRKMRGKAVKKVLCSVFCAIHMYSLCPNAAPSHVMLHFRQYEEC